MDLKLGAVSKALLEAAGQGLQNAVHSEATATMLTYGEVIITDGFRLKCQKVFHVVCPYWDDGDGQAEEVRKVVLKDYSAESLKNCSFI